MSKRITVKRSANATAIESNGTLVWDFEAYKLRVHDGATEGGRAFSFTPTGFGYVFPTPAPVAVAARNNQGDTFGYTFYAAPQFSLTDPVTTEKYAYASETPATVNTPTKTGAAKFGWSSREGYGYTAFGYNWPTSTANSPFINPTPVYSIGPSSVEAIAFASDTWSVKSTAPYFLYTSFPGSGAPTNFQRHTNYNTSGGQSLAGPSDGFVFGGKTPRSGPGVNPTTRSYYHLEQFGGKRVPFSADDTVQSMPNYPYQENTTRHGFASEDFAYLAGGTNVNPDGSPAFLYYPGSSTSVNTTQVDKMAFSNYAWSANIADTGTASSRNGLSHNSNEAGYVTGGSGPSGAVYNIAKMPFTSDTPFTVLSGAISTPTGPPSFVVNGPSTSSTVYGFSVIQNPYSPLYQSVTRFPFSSEDTFTDVGELNNNNNKNSPSYIAN